MTNYLLIFLTLFVFCKTTNNTQNIINREGRAYCEKQMYNTMDSVLLEILGKANFKHFYEDSLFIYIRIKHDTNLVVKDIKMLKTNLKDSNMIYKVTKKFKNSYKPCSRLTELFYSEYGLPITLMFKYSPYKKGEWYEAQGTTNEDDK